MELVDTHCHLTFDAFKSDIEQVIEQAEMAGVNRILVPGLDLPSSREAIDLAHKYQPVYAAIGVHPENVESFDDKQLASFEDLLIFDKVVAIGEVGLDYYHRQDQKDLQKRILKVFLNLAVSHSKPVILHSRDSLQDLINLIQNDFSSLRTNQISGIFHAFEGNLSDAKNISKMGFFLGAGGPITYKNALIKHTVFSKISLENIVLETDAPFLTPQFHRGKRNEPKYIPLIAERLAELQHCDIKEVADVTSGNAKNLFNWT